MQGNDGTLGVTGSRGPKGMIGAPGKVVSIIFFRV